MKCAITKIYDFSKNLTTHKEIKSVVVKRLSRALKNSISKHMTTVSINMYFNKLEEIVDKHNNAIIEQSK